MSGLRFDGEEARRALTVLFEDEQVLEVRALEARSPGDRIPRTHSGYFKDYAALIEAVESLQDAKAVCVTLNLINPSLLARCENRMRALSKGAATTSDSDIAARRWLFIDLDPCRPSGISSSNVEHIASGEKAGEVVDTLRQHGWPDPVLADSGNGHHLLYRIDLPRVDGGLVKGVLEALAFRFDDESVVVDQTVHNPARLLKLYGTWARKGDSTEERPHRPSKILQTPNEPEVVTKDQLHEVAAWAPQESQQEVQARPSRRVIGSFNLEAWIRELGLSVTRPSPWNGGLKWVFHSCPWNPDHQDRSAYLIQFGSGAIAAGCHHNGCAGNDWKGLRELLDPHREGAFGSFGSTPKGGG